MTPAQFAQSSVVSWYTLLLLALATVVSAAATFYAKDYLQKRRQYSKLREKLEKIAGKNATILFSVAPGPLQLFKIIEIDRQGVTLKNELQTIFVPSDRVLSTDIILPCDHYEEVRLAKMRKDMEQVMDSLMPAMFDRMFPAMKNALQEHFLEDLMAESGQVSAVIGVRIQKVLAEEGFEIRKRPQIPGQKP